MRPVSLRQAMATPVLEKRHQPALVPRHPEKTLTARALAVPDDPKPYHKGVAFALAVVLGFLGAHLFYLGRNRDGFRYLLFSLACATLCFIAVPVGTSAFVGGGLGGLIVALYILLAGLTGIAYTYLNALADGVRILQGKLRR
jgi:TM2 domain-containing membrane protein YozV